MLRRTASLLIIAAFTLALPAVGPCRRQVPEDATRSRSTSTSRAIPSTTSSARTATSPSTACRRIDNVDQDPDLPGDIREYVAVYAAYPDSGNKSLYHFKMENLAGGNAQMKLFLTCLGHNTEPNSYQVEWTLSNRKVDSHSGGPGLGSGFMPGGQQCGSGQQAVSPGFEFTSGVGRLVGSRTSFGGSGPPLGRNWSQVFVLDEPSNWKTYMRCLDTQSQPGPCRSAASDHRPLRRRPDVEPDDARRRPDEGAPGGLRRPLQGHGPRLRHHARVRARTCTSGAWTRGSRPAPTSSSTTTTPTRSASGPGWSASRTGPTKAPEGCPRSRTRRAFGRAALRCG